MRRSWPRLHRARLAALSAFSGIIALGGLGCSIDRSGVGSFDGGAPPPDAAVPDRMVAIDATAAADGDPDGSPTGDAGCLPGVPDSCLDDALLTCVSGHLEVVDCPLGCGGVPAGCRTYVPSNFDDAMTLASGTARLDLGSVTGAAIWVFDSDTGEITAGVASTPTVVRPAGMGELAGVQFRLKAAAMPDAPDLGVFALGNLVVPAGTTLVGIGDRALVILAADSVEIAGTVTVAADALTGRSQPGPGGSAGGAMRSAGFGSGAGSAGGENGADDGGGGGGGFGGLGANGGDYRGGSGGTPYGSEDLVPLYAGSGGGGGADDDGGRGGHGGGAMQLAAAQTILVETSGVINAGGGGGQGGLGPFTSSDVGAGGGGGSGGAILLEAPAVTILGRVGANGGGGGQGAPCIGCLSISGTAGSPLVVPAPGSEVDDHGGGGGHGSDALGRAQAGVSWNNAGGGGGGAGRIRINTRTGAERFDMGITPTTETAMATVGSVAVTP